MRTIESILEYNLSEHEKTCLYQCWIINGVWGEGQNIETVLLANIELLPWYDIDKAKQLLDDLREIATEHDIQFKFKMWFYKANFKFAKKLFHLLHWSGYKRFAISLLAFILLNKYGKPYYNK